MSDSDANQTAQTVVQKVRTARDHDYSTTKILEMLDDQFGHLPKKRAEAIVQAIPANEATSAGETDLSQDPETDIQPREKVHRRFGLNDVPYLSHREAARAIGLVLELFDGNTVRPPENSPTECNLYWNRQHSTVGVRVVPAPNWKVDTDEVRPLVEGETGIEGNRASSDLALVTNGTITSDAVTLAVDNDINCIEGGRLAAWLRRARVDRVALGTVLEDGENHDGPLSELVELDTVPQPRAQDPLTMRSVIDSSALQPQDDDQTQQAQKGETRSERNESNTTVGSSGGESSGRGSTNTDGISPGVSDPDTSNRRKKSQPDGEKGTLYADPEEDGDFEAFDRFADSLKSEESEQDRETNDDVADQEAVERDELILELLSAKKAVEYPITGDDILDAAIYSRDQYAAEFGSVSAALDQIGYDYEGENK